MIDLDFRATFAVSFTLFLVFFTALLFLVNPSAGTTIRWHDYTRRYKKSCFHYFYL